MVNIRPFFGCLGQLLKKGLRTPPNGVATIHTNLALNKLGMIRWINVCINMCINCQLIGDGKNAMILLTSPNTFLFNKCLILLVLQGFSVLRFHWPYFPHRLCTNRINPRFLWIRVWINIVKLAETASLRGGSTYCCFFVLKDS